jgi:hypothetical protein
MGSCEHGNRTYDSIHGSNLWSAGPLSAPQEAISSMELFNGMQYQKWLFHFHLTDLLNKYTFQLVWQLSSLHKMDIILGGQVL